MIRKKGRQPDFPEQPSAPTELPPIIRARELRQYLGNLAETHTAVVAEAGRCALRAFEDPTEHKIKFGGSKQSLVLLNLNASKERLYDQDMQEALCGIPGVLVLDSSATDGTDIKRYVVAVTSFIGNQAVRFSRSSVPDMDHTKPDMRIIYAMTSSPQNMPPPDDEH